MLNVCQPLFSAVEELVLCLFNGPSLVRLNRQPQNTKSKVSKHQVDQPPSICSSFLSSLEWKYLSTIVPSSSELHLNHLFQRQDPLKHCNAFTSSLRPVKRIHVADLTFTLCKSGQIFVQKRGFKTKAFQNRHAEESKGIWNSFLKNVLGISSLSDTKFGSRGTLFDSKSKVDADDVIKNLSKSSSKSDSEKLKIAFAEGFLASKQDKKNLFKSPLLTIVLVGVLIYVLFSMMQFRLGISSISEVVPEDVHVTFEDVKGIEEVKEEVFQIVSYLKDPEKFTRLGARLPKGVLLVGLPGSGKTLLAKAIAGEAGVPFFRTSGSEFEEMFVGLGAKRVRDLFATARARAPCVIFIDEIDSIGSKRSYSPVHPYANQTINQLLSEMDGFLTTAGVIVLAATNRRDDLDPALLRPGRFDVEVTVPYPDLKGRLDIFNLYLRKIKLDKDVKVEQLAKTTVGFSGADIENMVNQAALKAAADSKDTVNMHYLDVAHDLVKMGPKRHRIPDDEVNKNTAYHEAGHTLVGYFTKGSYPLHRVTIIPRGLSLGHTSYMPENEYNQSKSELLALMDVAMGGRAAEEIQFGADKVTTGAADDLKRATKIAEIMVKKFGMSDKVGLRFFNEDDERRYIVVNEYGQSTSDVIDTEIKRLLQESYDRAKSLLKTHSAAHTRLAEALLKYETLDADEIKLVIEGKQLDKPTL